MLWPRSSAPLSQPSSIWAFLCSPTSGLRRVWPQPIKPWAEGALDLGGTEQPCRPHSCRHHARRRRAVPELNSTIAAVLGGASISGDSLGPLLLQKPSISALAALRSAVSKP